MYMLKLWRKFKGCPQLPMTIIMSSEMVGLLNCTMPILIAMKKNCCISKAVITHKIKERHGWRYLCGATSTRIVIFESCPVFRDEHSSCICIPFLFSSRVGAEQELILQQSQSIVCMYVYVCMYCSLAKMGPWVVHLTLGSNRGVGRHSSYLYCVLLSTGSGGANLRVWHRGLSTLY